jgi:predicted nucleic acid-binding protein
VQVVIDASTIVAIIADEPERPEVLRKTSDAELIAPHSVHFEIGNAFSTMLKRRRITIEQALRSLESYRDISIRFVEVDLQESLRIASSLNIYAYDAYLLACAQKYRSPLLTLDRPLRVRAVEFGVEALEMEP